MTNMEIPNEPTSNNDGEPFFVEELLAATQAQRLYSHRTGAYTDKKGLMLCEAWLSIRTNPISSAKQKEG
jgi:hypothetical protein